MNTSRLVIPAAKRDVTGRAIPAWPTASYPATRDLTVSLLTFLPADPLDPRTSLVAALEGQRRGGSDTLSGRRGDHSLLDGGNALTRLRQRCFAKAFSGCGGSTLREVT